MKTYDLAPGRKPGRFHVGRKPLVLVATGNLLPDRIARRLLEAGTVVEPEAPPAPTPPTAAKKKSKKKASKKKKTATKAASKTRATVKETS